MTRIRRLRGVTFQYFLALEAVVKREFLIKLYDESKINFLKSTNLKMIFTADLLVWWQSRFCTFPPCRTCPHLTDFAISWNIYKNLIWCLWAGTYTKWYKAPFVLLGLHHPALQVRCHFSALSNARCKNTIKVIKLSIGIHYFVSAVCVQCCVPQKKFNKPKKS